MFLRSLWMFALAFVPFLLSTANAFVIVSPSNAVSLLKKTPTTILAAKKFGAGGGNQMTSARRKKLGISDDEDEYDLDKALDANTDPLITKIIAGSLIVAILGLLVVGVIVPSLTDYGEGVCSPIQNGGRC